MSELRQAAQQALKLMQKNQHAVADRAAHRDVMAFNAAITALRAALAEPVQEPVQEPVAWVECDGDLVWNNREAAIGRNLYTQQPQRKPLTDEEIDRITAERWGTKLLGAEMQMHREYARAIERAHGIISAEISGDKERTQGVGGDA